MSIIRRKLSLDFLAEHFFISKYLSDPRVQGAVWCQYQQLPDEQESHEGKYMLRFSNER